MVAAIPPIFSLLNAVPPSAAHPPPNVRAFALDAKTPDAKELLFPIASVSASIATVPAPTGRNCITMSVNLLAAALTVIRGVKEASPGAFISQPKQPARSSLLTVSVPVTKASVPSFSSKTMVSVEPAFCHSPQATSRSPAATFKAPLADTWVAPVVPTYPPTDAM